MNVIGIRSALDSNNVGEPDKPVMATDGVSSQAEIIEDFCIICLYFDNEKQRVKECEWTEGSETFSALLCKPCYVSLQSIELGGSL